MTALPVAGGLRGPAICGILFAVNFAAGGILLGELFGSFADSDATFVEYFESTSNRNGSAIGGVLLFVSGIALLPFVSGLVRMLTRERTSWAMELVAPLTYVVSGLIIASAAALSTVGLARVFADITDESSAPFQGSSIAVLPQFGYVLMVFASWTMVVLLSIVASASMRTRAMPRAVGIVTIVCAVMLVLAPSGLALVGAPVWGLVTAISMLRRRTAAAV